MSHSSGIIRELFTYAVRRKKVVLLPILIVMLILGAVLIFAQGSVLAPFIYTLF